VTILGVSFDAPGVNKGWAEDEGFTFDLWSDGEKELATYYEAIRTPNQLHADRVTKVLDADGVLVLEYVDGIDVGESPALVLADCKALFGG
jgi:peroxiredoxin